MSSLVETDCYCCICGHYCRNDILRELELYRHSGTGRRKLVRHILLQSLTPLHTRDLGGARTHGWKRQNQLENHHLLEFQRVRNFLTRVDIHLSMMVF